MLLQVTVCAYMCVRVRVSLASAATVQSTAALLFTGQGLQYVNSVCVRKCVHVCVSECVCKCMGHQAGIVVRQQRVSMNM